MVHVSLSYPGLGLRYTPTHATSRSVNHLLHFPSEAVYTATPTQVIKWATISLGDVISKCLATSQQLFTQGYIN